MHTVCPLKYSYCDDKKLSQNIRPTNNDNNRDHTMTSNKKKQKLSFLYVMD